MTYENYKETFKKPQYFGQKCYVVGCNNPAEYEGGDERFYCGVCEKHSGILELWKAFNKKIKITFGKAPKMNKKEIYKF